MKLKSIFCFLFLISFGTVNTQAQLRLGTGLNLGYGCGAVIDYLSSNYTEDSAGNFTDEVIYGSHAAGLNFGLLLQARICDFGDAEFGFGGFNGRKYTFTSHESYGVNTVNNEIETQKASGWYLEPMVRLHTNNEGKINYYIRQGLFIGMGIKNKITNVSTYEVDTFYSQMIDWKAVDRGRIAIGYTGELGVAYNPNSNYEFNLGVNFRGVNVSMKTRSITDFTQTSMTGSITTVSGIDTLDVNQKETIYKKIVTDTDNITNELPSVQLMDYHTYSTWGIQLRFIYHFGAAVSR